MFPSRINPMTWPRRRRIVAASAVVLIAAGWFVTPLVVEQVEYYTWHR